MPVNFPPQSVFPYDIDSDYTLFLVYNTSQTVITADNPAWADEILIKPVASDANEIWAENGFANIEGELFYYDSVSKNAHGKIYKFNNCIRNIGGTPTKYVPKGGEVRGFVIAEHHNQLVDAIINVERYIGTVDCDDSDTLVCCLDELEVDECEDDGICPNVSFSFDVAESPEDVCQGTTINYFIAISGTYNNFRVDFGDGTFTTVAQDGTKTYPPGVDIDPVLTVSNDFCQVVVTGVERDVDTEPAVATETDDLIIPFIEVVVPSLTFTTPEIPEPDIYLPPIVRPCIDLEPINIDIGPISIGDISVPSVISIISPDIPSIISIIPPDIPGIISIIPPEFPTEISIIPPEFPTEISIIPPDFPTEISFIPPEFPTEISIIPPEFPTEISVIVPEFPTEISIVAPDFPTVISITPPEFPEIVIVPPDIPSIITVVDSIPSVITVNGDIPSTINLVGEVPSTITLVGDIPTTIELVASISNISLVAPDIGPISVDWGTPPTLSCTVSVQCPTSSPMAMKSKSMLDSLQSADDFNDAFADLGIEYDVVGIPSEIVIKAPEFPTIKVESNIPSEIKIADFKMPSVIEHTWAKGMTPVVTLQVPDELPEIKINAAGVPSQISIVGPQIPSEISVIMPTMPSVITIEHDIPSTISVEGIPESLVVSGGVSIENPSVEMFYRGDPIEVVVKVDMAKVLSDDEGSNCVRIIPCK